MDRRQVEGGGRRDSDLCILVPVGGWDGVGIYDVDM
jgi:hypothetical protein